MELRRELTLLYLQIGSVLNSVMDDDERERLQEHGEQVLNHELWAGSQNRKLVEPLTTALRGAGFEPVDNVIAIPVGSHSMRVIELQDGEPSDDYMARRGPYLMDARSENDPSL